MQMNKEYSSIYQELVDIDNKKRLRVTGQLSDKMIEKILCFDYDILHLDFGDWSSLDFLTNYKNRITQLKITSEKCDWETINSLDCLEQLTVGGWFKTNLSFSRFKHLKYLYTYWNEGFNDDIYKLPSLETLAIIGGEEITLKKFRSLKKLKKLELLNSYKLKSCEGIEYLTDLEEIDFFGLRKLTDVQALGQLRSLQTLSIEGCNKLINLNGLQESRSIKKIYINKCKNIQDFCFSKGHLSQVLILLVITNSVILSLKSFKGLSKLEVLSLVGTKVVDGDLSILKKLPKLRDISLRSNRNFHPSAYEIKQYINYRNQNGQ